MALVALPLKWKVFFYVEVFLIVSTGATWMVTPDAMNTMYGFTDESVLYRNWSWTSAAGHDNQQRSPVTPQQFGALVAGQVLCLSYGYVLFRMVRTSKLDYAAFSFLLEAMTIGDVAQVLIMGYVVRNGIAVYAAAAAGTNAIAVHSQLPLLSGVYLSSAFAVAFGVIRAYFIYFCLPHFSVKAGKD